MFADRGGFTLVEILVGLVILSMVIITSTLLLTQSTFSIFLSGEKSTGIFEAQSFLEREVYGSKTGNHYNLTITFLGDFEERDTLSIDLVEVEGEYIYQGHSGTLRYLVPQ